MSSFAHVAILVSQAYGPDARPHVDDVALLHTLEAAGFQAELVVWDDATIRPSSYQAALIRSCWDYDQRVEEFLSRMKQWEEGTLLLNPYPILEENADKHYLKTLEAAGIPIVPSRFLERGEEIVWPSSWEKVIVKPTVSGSGKNTYLLLGSDREGIEARCEELWSLGKTVLLQEYYPSVESYGERSTVLIEGEACFTMHKIPAKGNFLVHDHFGGSYLPGDIEGKESAFLKNLVERLPRLPLYVRVDYLRDEEGNCRLLELEMIEPRLYFAQNTKGLRLLVDGLKRRLHRGK